MPKRRDQVRMSQEEIWKFIEERKSLQFASIDRDGAPHLVTLWFAIVDGKIAVETYTKSQKVRNLERDPRVTLLLEDGLVYQELRGVSIKGVVELHRDPEVVHRISMEVYRRNTPEIPEELLEKASSSQAAKKTAILVKPERTISWDHRKLAGIY